ncbi:DUF1488 family protein [Janthinobacterium psychrotolerans]|uniref:DUF1488 domain-containing protein n=1 Tax=Janthinobacterium psychrotolerans TaxID=1747903 RepID=A0A1A7BYT9_9BURK|nr:DUF1488 family protein [Janthinobacterium psychrotolerans]OBV38806.1 Protein of unknown function (DUF1488) [Janthinobacterium psychrotolerans]
MPYQILRNSVCLDQADGAITFHLAVFGAGKVCRVTSTALLSLGNGQGEALSVFEAHRQRIAQRAFSYLSRNLMASGVVLRALDF